MFEELTPIVIGCVAGAARGFVGYVKARLKHGEGFSMGKFSTTIVIAGAVGGAANYFQMLPDLLTVAVAIAGTVLIGELLQAIFLRKPKVVGTVEVKSK